MLTKMWKIAMLTAMSTLNINIDVEGHIGRSHRKITCLNRIDWRPGFFFLFFVALLHSCSVLHLVHSAIVFLGFSTGVRFESGLYMFE